MTSDTAKPDSTHGSRDPAVQMFRPQPAAVAASVATGKVAAEVGGRKDGTEPTRFGDWEKAGRCIDF
jgi:hypothetical protein